ncbi:MAG: hypothetical protein H6765_00425 [Candidatus Peribacteria bacterium]|nr:MAG: hypothetical protein H6765_00425 [Candidatus Peribacteria bacterium]
MLERLCVYSSNKCRDYLEKSGVEVIVYNKMVDVNDKEIVLEDGSRLASDVTILSS